MSSWNKKHRRLAALALYLSPFILLIALVVYISYTHKSGGANQHGIRYRVMALVYLSAAGTLWNFAKKLAASNATEAMSSDLRPPILYLRSFAQDADTGPKLPQYGATDSNEEAMSRLFSSIGPIIAAGEPGKRLPDLGASRDYLPQASWRPWIHTQMMRSQFVVILAGASPSLEWEIRTALTTVKPDQVIIQTDVAPEVYAEFAEQFTRLFPAGLPSQESRSAALLERVKIGTEGSIPSFSEFIIFDPQWNPIMLHSKLSWFDRSRTIVRGHSPVLRYANALRSSKRPVLVDLRVRVTFFEIIAWGWFSFLLIGLLPIVMLYTETRRFWHRRRLQRMLRAI